MTEEEQGYIYIDESREALSELLSLTIERMRAYRKEETPEYGAYFENLFGFLTDLYDGKTPVLQETGSGTLLSFWEHEAGCLEPGSAEKVPGRFLSVMETSLLLLSTFGGSREDGKEVSESEIRDLLYSYVFDYSVEFLTDYVTGKCRMRSLITDFVFGRSDLAAEYMPLFWGERLRTRVLDTLTSLKKDFPEEFSSLSGLLLPVSEDAQYTPHQNKVLGEYARKIRTLFLLTLSALFLVTSCGRKEAEEPETEAASQSLSEIYPGLVEVKDRDGEVRDVFGVMHALCLDVQPGEKSGLYVYTLCDRQDQENAWSIESRYVGDIFADVSKGSEVAVLFSGNIVEDPDSVEFVAFLPEKKYSIRSASGKVVNNMMTSFTLRTKTGEELTFVKDNCKVDRDALSTESGGEVLVYYADSGSLSLYPFRVYNENGK